MMLLGKDAKAAKGAKPETKAPVGKARKRGRSHSGRRRPRSSLPELASNAGRRARSTLRPTALVGSPMEQPAERAALEHSVPIWDPQSCAAAAEEAGWQAMES